MLILTSVLSPSPPTPSTTTALPPRRKHSSAMMQVWSVSNSEWHCKIDEGPVGLAYARWSPDGRHVLAASDFNLRITIWSLLDRAVYYIRYPKFSHEGLDFTKDGKLMALAERREMNDFISIFNCLEWTPVNSFEVGTQASAVQRIRCVTICQPHDV